MTTPETSEKPIVYTHPDCDFSNMLKEELTQEGTEFEEIDLSTQPEKWGELEKLTSGDRTTPVIIRNGNVEVGYHGIG
ncbi:MAG: UXX-star (seleno)protein family 2 [Chloroflexota bacterium]